MLERDFATIPIPGINGPFHSRYLWAGVMPFRACKLWLTFLLVCVLHPFCRSLGEDHCFPPQSRHACWGNVPNLVARPFEITKVYAQLKLSPHVSIRFSENGTRIGVPLSNDNNLHTFSLNFLPTGSLPQYDVSRPKISFSKSTTSSASSRLDHLLPLPVATRMLKAKYESGDNSVSRTCAILCHASTQRRFTVAPAASEASSESLTIVSLPAVAAPAAVVAASI